MMTMITLLIRHKDLLDKRTPMAIISVKLHYYGCERTPVPISLSAVAAVTDMNHQTQQSTVNMTVHPAAFYVGHRFDRAYGKKK